MFRDMLTKLGNLLTADFLKKAFSDNGQPSSARLLTIPHSICSIGCLLYITIKTGGHPDPLIVTSLGGFSTVHYVVNRVTTAYSQSNQNPQQQG